ncbi:hypothetical protein CH373_06745 [Leptospira perolatii]|uniref:DUF2029 domain-containing protein n=1 Tax=Leptospira perolatii TaxID=2023191 RepID=A0A2M9ZPN4_9LEPT|nr:glycosyltransferase family 87 protein [Leptospira perolatii]PJZ70914.1 hypothetical protein CH360_03605 [Leptospira perolatii]PJZ74037.1 hypothetical protein CH373_06745 [Leptospira perolatii]
MRTVFEKRIPLLLFSFLLVFLYISGIGKVSQTSDFKDYFQASQNFRDKKDLYNLDVLEDLRSEFESGKLDFKDIFQPEVFEKLKARMDNVGAYIYPPTFAFLLVPISFFPYEVASGIFFTLNFLALLGSLYLISKILHRENQYLFLSLAVLLSVRFIENHQNNNQVGLLLLFLILSSVVSKKDWLSGLLLGLAIVIKVTPAAFLFYFLFKKRYGAIFYTIGFAVLWACLPALSDPGFTWNMNRTWYELVLEKYLKSPMLRAWKNNQSLNATLAKYFLPYSDIMNQGRFGMPFIDLTVFQVKWIGNLLTLTIAGPYLYKVYKGASEAFVLSGLFFFSVLFSGISWIHAFVFLIFPAAYILGTVWPKDDSIPKLETWKDKRNRSSFVFLSMSLFILLANRSLIGSGTEEKLLMFSYLLYTSLIQYFCLFFISPGDTEKS